MKTKKRSLFLIAAACCLGVGAVTFSNLNPISAIYADNISYGMTFNSSKNKFHNYSGATPYSGEATVKTNLDNNINFEYKDLMGLNNTWHVVKAGGYFTNLDPINGLEKINISFKTNNIDYKIYWSYSKTFDEENVYTGTSSTSSPLNFNFNRSYPSFFKFENVGGTNLNISEINFEFTCLNGAPTINVASNDETLGTVSGGGTYVYGEKVSLIAYPNIGVEFVGWYENDVLVSKDNPYTFNAEFNRNIIGKFAIKTYQVKVNYDSMMGSVSGVGSYSYGDNVVLKAISNNGYSFFGWYKNNSLKSQESEYEFTMADKNVELEARFVKNYKICLYNDNEELGILEGPSECGAGLEVTVSAIPFEGFFLQYWYDENLNEVCYDSLYTFVMPNHDVYLHACFVEAIEIKVVNKNENYVTLFGEGLYKKGSIVTLQADFNKGNFIGWYKGNEIFSKQNPLTFMCDENIVLEARWHNLTIKGTSVESCPDDIKHVYIPEGIKKIEYKAFYEHSSLVSITIPKSLTLIAALPGFGAFYGCNALTHVYYEGDIEDWCNILFGHNASYTAANSNPMYYAKHFFLLNESYEWYEVVEIEIPETITKIGRYQFYGFSCVTSFSIPDSVTSIGGYAFYGCKSLTSVTIGNNVTSIGEYAFSDCSSVQYNKFDNCYYLGNIENPYCVLMSTFDKNCETYNINSNCKIIYNGAFSNCTDLISITIPNSVVSIGQSAFKNCTSLTSITIPFVGDGTTENTHFGYIFGASSYSSNADYVPETLKKVIIGDSCTYIGKNAFYNCYNIEVVVISDSVKSIGSSAFYGCSSLTSITLPFIGDGTTNNTHFGYIFGASSYSENGKFVPSSLKEVIISDICTSIGDDAFSNCSSLTSITIPDSVTSIGRWAFSSCTSLTNVYYKGTIEDWCDISFLSSSSNPMYYADHFYMLNESNEWYEVTEIVIPDSVTKIGNYQFYGFENVTSITIPDSVTSIGYGAFSNCTSLTSITIPDSVTSIGDYAFSRCSSLTSITIPDSVTSIGDDAFSNCTSLTSVTIGNSVTSIGDYAFYNCDSLTSITIPDSVTSIGYSAFRYSDSLTNIDFGGTTDAWGKISFYSNWKPSNLKTITCTDGVITV